MQKCSQNLDIVPPNVYYLIIEDTLAFELKYFHAGVKLTQDTAEAVTISGDSVRTNARFNLECSDPFVLLHGALQKRIPV